MITVPTDCSAVMSAMARPTPSVPVNPTRKALVMGRDALVMRPSLARSHALSRRHALGSEAKPEKTIKKAKRRR
ncbi:hypothetical protein GCM10009700_25980 [Brevibacterium sanguinis]